MTSIARTSSAYRSARKRESLSIRWDRLGFVLACAAFWGAVTLLR